MNSTNLMVAPLTTTLAAYLSSAASAENVKVGALRCEVSAGLGLVIMSSKEIECRFTPARGRSELYHGMIRKFGLDIGATNRGVLVWDVFSAIEGRRDGALQGDYDGVDGSATVGLGAGVSLLVGGYDRAFTLQPLSLEGQTGLALIAGVESLTLRGGL